MRPLWMVVGGALWASAVHAEPLTLAAALAEARASAPNVAAQASMVDAARSAVIPAGALPDPKASVGVTDFPISGPLAGRPDRDNFSMLSLGFSQEVPNRAKRHARVEQAQANVTAARSSLTVAQQKAEVAAGKAWVALYYAERKLSALDKLQQELVQERDAAPARLLSGAARPAMTLEPQQLLAVLADRREALRAELLQARAALGRWIDGAATAEPSGPPPSMDLDPVALRAHLDALPIMQVAAAKIDQAEAATKEARAEKQPDWGYHVQYDHRDPRFGDYVSGQVSFSLPIFAKTRQDPEIASRLAEVNSALAEQEATRRDLRADLDSALAEHILHHSQLARARETLLPLAQRRAELETASYQARTASLADVLAARRDEVEAELNVLDREADTAEHVVDIALTYGEQDQ
ncbi:TolC family protein [Caulobacter sp. S45]|uniref:TolC family protein n=1 Tax=Caulobacter sp. S45 TaxID=1641861 RepID=UPI00131E4E97|nr:TolC family protein [Caulobacter sp. S45]